MSQEVASNIANPITTAATLAVAAPTPALAAATASVPTTAPTSTLVSAPIAQVPVPVAPTTASQALALSTTPSVSTKESLSYFAKAQNYIQSMSTRNSYILFAILTLILAVSIYYIWNKLFCKKQDSKKIMRNLKDKPREWTELYDRSNENFDPRYPPAKPRNSRLMNYHNPSDQEAYQHPNNKKYPKPECISDQNEHKTKSDKSNESSQPNDKTKIPIFSNGNQYGEVYVGESLDIGQQGQQQGQQSQPTQIVQQQNTATIPDDIANYEPDGQTAN